MQFLMMAFNGYQIRWLSLNVDHSSAFKIDSYTFYAESHNAKLILADKKL